MKEEDKGVQFSSAIDHTFYGFTGVMTPKRHVGREHEKSL